VASSPADITLAQPVARVCIFHLGKLISSIKCPSGIAMPQDVIIQALHLGISKALVLLPDISFIQVFTTNLPAMTPALKADISSNQGHKIAIANTLTPWLSLGDMRTVHFWAVPSRVKWPPLQRLIDDINNTTIATGQHPIYTIDSICLRCVSAVNTTWSSEFFNNPGLCFLHLRDTGDRLLWPTYVNGGAWLTHFGSLSMTTWAVQAITVHAPIREYRHSFFSVEPHFCRHCGAHLEMREHILYECPHYFRRSDGKMRSIGYFQWFLEDNLDMFAFEDPLPPMGVG
jgi:hypothetical protein